MIEQILLTLAQIVSWNQPVLHNEDNAFLLRKQCDPTNMGSESNGPTGIH